MLLPLERPVVMVTQPARQCGRFLALEDRAFLVEEAGLRLRLKTSAAMLPTTVAAVVARVLVLRRSLAVTVPPVSASSPNTSWRAPRLVARYRRGKSSPRALGRTRLQRAVGSYSFAWLAEVVEVDQIRGQQLLQQERQQHLARRSWSPMVAHSGHLMVVVLVVSAEPQQAET